jgi:predicted transcriptional regulator
MREVVMILEQKQISQRILWLMRDLGLNQKQLADHLQVTQPAVSKYLKERIPPPGVLLKLAQLSNTTMEWILTGEDTIIRTRVAEREAVYGSILSGSDKLNNLPVQIQKCLIDLIEVLLQHYR